jgi:hypothetical protein
MNDAKNSRTIRLIMGALAGSSLSTSQLRSFGAALRDDPNFATELGWRVDGLAKVLGDIQPGTGVKTALDGSQRNMLKRLESAVKRNRVSKAEIIQFVARIAPELAKTFEEHATLKGTTRELLRQLVEQTPLNRLQELARNLGEVLPPEDLYLKGIAARGRE